MTSNFDAPVVYANELTRHAGQWLGHPLWYPDPDDRGDVQIGDVGYIVKGRFKRVFNTLDNTPQNLQGLRYNTTLNDPRPNYVKAGTLASQSVKVRGADGAVEGFIPGGATVSAGCSFECSSHQGAILHLQAPGDMLAVEHNNRFATYMKTNHRSWVNYIEENLGSSVEPTDVVLVSGHVKTSEWAVAAFQSTTRTANAFINATLAPSAGAGFELTISDQTGMHHAHHWGPQRRVAAPTPYSSMTSLGTPGNQCIFLSYYKIKYRLGLFPKVMAAGAGPAPLPDQPPEERGSAVLALDDMEVETEAPGQSDQPTSPVDALLDYILANSKADVAIASHGELEMFIGDEHALDVTTYLRIHQPMIHVDEDNVGRLSLESLVLAQQRRRRALIQPDYDDADPEKRYGAPNIQGAAERVVLAGGKTLQWLDTVLKDDSEDGVAISSFSISKDGEFLLTSLDNYNIKLWHIPTGQHIREYPGHLDTVLTVAFAPDGMKFVSGSADSTARLWDVEPGLDHPSSVLGGHEAWVWCVAYSPDGKTIATGSFDQTVHLWNPDGKEGPTLEHDGQVTLLDFSPDSKTILTVADSDALLWDCNSGQKLLTLSAHTATIWSMGFSPQGDRIVTSSDDSTARIWDAQTGNELVILHEHTGPIWTSEFSPDGQYVVTGSLDETIAVCDSFSGENKFIISERPAHVHSVSYSHDGSYIASGDAEGLVKLWDASSGAFVAEFQGHQEKVKSVAWTPDDKYVVSSSDDGSARIWSIHDLLRFL
ncbi:hypothetical protein NM688_g3652 [Phlebia brevispora]|uniref:Uncharacterized protein n=1 Tax=Phlebia brevispora TaxID=194682 RepID=A0ACC1T549_9APHY|nr:hypothetical protein NM688_g3652 [Phlebia brevispora]